MSSKWRLIVSALFVVVVMYLLVTGGAVAWCVVGGVPSAGWREVYLALGVPTPDDPGRRTAPGPVRDEGPTARHDGRTIYSR
jgi:hypothetical protein